MRGSESETHFANPTANAAAPHGNFLSLPPPKHAGKPSHFRQLVESLLCLALAVMVFRTFLVEGYMISTGSMGPYLLGFHKQVVCPTCQFPFAFGVSYQTEGSRTISGDNEGQTPTEDFNGHATEPQLCTCPNCGQRAIDISQVPRNQGDQLLVYREAYWMRMPRRWEVIVFRNPYETTQAYVKRLAGLPGETIVIREGDVYANGTLCRKDYPTQNVVRIPVYNHNFEPTDDPEWQPRWQPDNTWKREGHGFVTTGETRSSVPEASNEINENSAFDLKLSSDETPFDWVTYGHYVRVGGWHVTKLIVPALEEILKWPHDLLPAQFDAKTRQLSIQGVMSLDLRERLRGVSNDPKFHQVVDQLYHRSHFSPVTDDYGYNRTTYQSGKNAVRDLMLSIQLSAAKSPATGNPPRQFAIDMTDGQETFRCLLDFQQKEIRLLGNPEQAPGAKPLRTAPLKPEWENEPCQIEMSLFDRQVSVAIDGEEIFPAWPIPTPIPTKEAPRFPVRVGTRGLAARVDSLKLFRDVYYTSKGDEKPFPLKEDELYVLGDNSPISLDSRRWDNGAVPLRLLLGKPFVVHLPSRQMKIRLGESIRHIRVPDFSRIRYIR